MAREPGLEARLRRSSFLRVGYLWNRGAEDSEWHFRAVEKGLWSAVIPKVLLRRRIFDKHVFVDQTEARSALLRAVRDHAERSGQLDALRGNVKDD